MVAQQPPRPSEKSRVSRAQRNITTDGLDCKRFEWNSDSIAKRAVMRVPISLDGRMYWYQLDIGADVLITYGRSTHEGWEPRGDALRIPKVRFAGMYSLRQSLVHFGL
jgi:hypothetical protein